MRLVGRDLGGHELPKFQEPKLLRLLSKGKYRERGQKVSNPKSSVLIFLGFGILNFGLCKLQGIVNSCGLF